MKVPVRRFVYINVTVVNKIRLVHDNRLGKGLKGVETERKFDIVPEPDIEHSSPVVGSENRV